MDDDTERDIARVWRVNRTVRELCRDRGYTMSEQEINMSLQKFTESYTMNGHLEQVSRTALNFHASRHVPVAGREETEVQQIYVFFAEERSLGIKPVREFLTVLLDRNLHSGILIYKQSITPPALRASRALSSALAQAGQHTTAEALSESELLVNITQHTLVPKHEVLSPMDKAELLKKYRLKDTQLPRILLSDPVARYYGLKRGQVVKITRPSGKELHLHVQTAGRYASYRLAVAHDRVIGTSQRGKSLMQDSSATSALAMGAKVYIRVSRQAMKLRSTTTADRPLFASHYRGRAVSDLTCEGAWARIAKSHPLLL
ncbi:uncharacterized protein L969DRAFT_69223 [Mixia osmundae IAM 14324]|uniref:uncharacterized protein n=1 Tax=Mixia osmundae (strain CBS 9802 / IAM 14324 / JCM 22182 / KY 12970) TaxID=764103 RepID=UPI0004A55154|nr:uncharacterized protein L969DRAFT_69223 [Mixia osmundae IAM 14324]KEI42291.1 hypothetical protein L969DRAFT_69223 [Mixia osmundae IAM 14324]